jgi:uncharacterized ParB-like nuclease family protein
MYQGLDRNESSHITDFYRKIAKKAIRAGAPLPDHVYAYFKDGLKEASVNESISKLPVHGTLPLSLLRDPHVVDLVRTTAATCIRTPAQQKALQEDIKVNGIKQPIELAVESGKRLTIIDGTHRLKALDDLVSNSPPHLYDHLKNVPVSFLPGSVKNGRAFLQEFGTVSSRVVESSNWRKVTQLVEGKIVTVKLYRILEDAE